MPEPDDPMDQLLRSTGERWRATLPPVPDPASGRSRRTRPSPWRVVAAVAAVVVVVGGISVGVTALGHGDHRALPPSASGVSASATVLGVVPWRPFPATNPTLPTVLVPASPGPDDGAGVRRCSQGDLRAAGGLPDGAAGTTYLPVHLTLVGTRPCRLEGYPLVQPLDQGQPLALPVQHEHDGHAPFGRPVPVVVRPGQPALFRVGWPRTHSCPVMDNDALRITLPGGAPFTIAGFGASFCDPGEPGPAAMTVEAVQPYRYVPSHTTSPYEHVTVTGDLHLSATVGSPVDFTVTLASDQDLPLSPCPDYSIAVGETEDRYALNCAAVPHRDPQGRPYLPAGVPVTFAMHTAPISTSPTKLVWQLVTPPGIGHPSLGGLVTLAGEAPD